MTSASVQVTVGTVPTLVCNLPPGVAVTVENVGLEEAFLGGPNVGLGGQPLPAGDSTTISGGMLERLMLGPGDDLYAVAQTATTVLLVASAAPAPLPPGPAPGPPPGPPPVPGPWPWFRPPWQRAVYKLGGAFTLSSLSKYWKGIIAVLSFASVIITAFLSTFGNVLPSTWTAAIAGIGVFVGGVLAFLQSANPLSPQEKAVVAAMRTNDGTIPPALIPKLIDAGALPGLTPIPATPVTGTIEAPGENPH